MAGIQLSGLASGVDTSSIVDQLMQLERQKVTRINNRSTTVLGHQTALKAVADKLNALSSAALALSDSTTWKTAQTSTSSDTGKVTVAQLDGAGIGGHTVSVDRLASSAQHGFAYVASGNAGSFTITSGTQSASISVGANASAKDIANAINASTTAPVYAAVVKDDSGNDRIVMSSRKTGHSNDFTVDTTGLGADGALTEDVDYERPPVAPDGTRTLDALDALFSVDGVAKSSQTNSSENAIPGLRITLNAVTSSPVSITTNEATIDKGAIKSKVKAFVDAYNAVVDLTRNDIAEKSVANASTTADLQKGTLFGDLGLTGMLSSLKDTLTKPVPGIGNLSSLADIGIGAPKSTGFVTEDAKAGHLTFDETAFDTQLDKDWTQVQKLFGGVGATKGFGQLTSDFVRGQTGLKGILTSRMNSDSTSLKDLANQVTATNARLDQTQARLKAQFAAMETAMSNSQAQQSWLTGQIAALQK